MPIPVALISIIPEILRQLKSKPHSGVKEAAGLSIVGSLALISNDTGSCAVDGWYALSCVTPDHWGTLIAASAILLARLNGKRKES